MEILRCTSKYNILSIMFKYISLFNRTCWSLDDFDIGKPLGKGWFLVNFACTQIIFPNELVSWRVASCENFFGDTLMFESEMKNIHTPLVDNAVSQDHVLSLFNITQVNLEMFTWQGKRRVNTL